MPRSLQFFPARAAALLLALLLAGTAHAGSIAAEPLRLTLPAGSDSMSLSAQNPGKEPIEVQAEVVAWSQRGSEETLDASADFTVTPSTFTLAPGAAQSLLLTLTRRNETAREVTYRLFLTEVPPPRAPDQIGPTVAVRLSLPVFVLPHAPAAPQATWRVVKRKQGGIEVSLSNIGNAHIQVISVRFYDAADRLVAEGNLGGYVLPGQTRTWQIGAGGRWESGRIRLIAHTDAGDLSAQVTAE